MFTMHSKIILTILLLLMVSFPAFAENIYELEMHYEFGTYFGGTDNALDSVDGNKLSGGEVAHVNYAYGTLGRIMSTRHICKVGIDLSAAPENISIIAPVNNPGAYPNNPLWFYAPSYAYGTTVDPDTSWNIPNGADYQKRTAE